MKFIMLHKAIILWIILFMSFIWLFLIDSYSENYVKKFHLTPEVREEIPAGEIISGFRLEQIINWNSFNISKLNKFDTFCINLLMANYNNRINSGNFSLTLQGKNSLQKIIADSHIIKDNSNQIFCFDKIPLSEITYQPSALMLEGINSPPGQAVTAWLTADTALGKIQRDGVIQNKSLVFSIDVMTASVGKLMQAILLTVFCGVSISILLWPTGIKSDKEKTH